MIPVTQNAFHWTKDPNWKKFTPSLEINQKFLTSNSFQTLVFHKTLHQNYSILVGPPGVGKSKAIIAVSAEWMHGNPTLKTVIAVPQTLIANGFLQANIKTPSGKKIEWSTNHNLCHGSETSKANQLVAFLKKSYKTVNGYLADGVVVCSYNTLIAAYKKLKEENQLKILKDLNLWVDEAHHLQSTEDDLGGIQSNQLATVVNFLVHKKNAHIKVGLATATPFRGDKLSLLTKDIESHFQKVFYPFDAYLRDTQYLESISYDFITHNHDVTAPLKQLFKKRLGKTIVNIPHPNSNHSSGKVRDVDNILKTLQKVYGGTYHYDKETGRTLLKTKTRTIKIVDLVDEKDRQKKKDYIDNNSHIKDSIDVIIALGMFKEGADWIWADRLIVVGTRNSLNEMCQLNGRLYRDTPGKNHVETFQLLPFAFDQLDKEEFSNNLNDYLKVLFLSLLVEDWIQPVRINLPKTNEEKDPQGNQPELTIDPFNELPYDQRQRLFEDVKNFLLDRQKDQDTKEFVKSLRDQYEKEIPEIIRQYVKEADIPEVMDHIWNTFARRTLALSGIDVRDISIELIKQVNPLGWLLIATSGICGIKTFEALRHALGNRSLLSIEEILEWADHHKQQTGKYPDRNSGPVLHPDAKGETWCNINSYLIHGYRGLPGGSSLAKLLEEHREYRNIQNLAPLVIDRILDWLDYDERETGKIITKYSGPVLHPDAKGEIWYNIDACLKRGLRGQPGGSSLVKLSEKYRNYRNSKNLPPITIDRILKYQDHHKQITGKYANKHSGPVLHPDAKGETWNNLEYSLNHGTRGLPGGDSLISLLETYRNHKNLMTQSMLTYTQIIKWIIHHKEIKGKIPSRTSGPVLHPDADGETWSRIYDALYLGLRGLPGGMTIQTLSEENGICVNLMNIPLCEDQIRVWVQDHRQETGKNPTSRSGPVLHPDAKGEKWDNIDTALVYGRRGLLKGSSLSKFIKQYCNET